MKKYLFTIVTISLAFSLNAQLCLTATTDSPHSVGTNPYSLTSADFNSDGIADLVVVNSGSASLSLLLGIGSGSFAPAVSFAPVASPYAVTSADFNADGKADLAVTYWNDIVSVLLGNGAGSFAPPISFSVGATPQSVTSADFNADGNADLAVANRASGNVSVLLGIGTGSFAPAVNFATGSLPYSVISSDFNADGKADLAVANFSGNDVSVLIGNGTGSFAPAVNFGVGSGAVSVTSADFNADGKADLATANYNNNSVSVLIGNGTGSFATAVNFAVGPIPSSITSGDFNSDGKGDLATANYNNNTVSVLLSLGAGSFASAVNFAVGSYPYSILSSDFNADSKADLAVTNFNGNNVTILLNGPSVSANATATVVCTGESITLSGSGATSYTWSGSVTDGVAFNPPTGSTTYTVTGTNATGCTNTATKLISVNALPTLTTSVNSSSICNGGNVILNVVGASTYTWNPGNLSGTTVTVSPTSNTTYSVIGKDINGCSNSATKSVTVNSLPTLTTSASSSSICNGSNIILNVIGASTYTWNPGNLSGTTVTVSPTSNLTYSVIGTDNNGCSNSATKTVTVISLPTLTTSASSSSICNGGNVILNVIGASTYTWNPGNLSGATVTVSPTSNITYSIIGTDINGCSNSTTKSVTVNSLPIMSLIVTDIKCNNQSNGSIIINTSGGTLPYSYIWSNGNFSAQSNTLTAGNYTIQVTDVKNCSTNTIVTIINPPLFTASVNVSSPSCIGMTDGIAQLTINGGITPYSINWSNGITTLENSNISAGNYSVIISDANNCTNTLNVLVQDTSLSCFIIPNGFSPNGDGINDTWEIAGITNYPNAQVTVLNRWGQEVFKITNYTTPWNGSYNGNLLPTADYYYIIKLDDNTKTLTGTLTIKR